MKCPKHTTGNGPCYCEFIKAAERLAEIGQMTADTLRNEGDSVNADRIQEEINIVKGVNEHA